MGTHYQSEIGSVGSTRELSSKNDIRAMFKQLSVYHRLVPLALFLCLQLCVHAPAVASVSTTIDFNGLVHGQVVDDEFISQGVAISADNLRTSDPRLDLAVIFDTNIPRNQTQDPDLGDPFGGPDGNTPGNLPANTFLGNALIIQEVPAGNSRSAKKKRRDLRKDAEDDGIINNSDGDSPVTAPDDEGGRPAGSIMFDFAFGITSFGFDLIDIELSEVAESYFVTFFTESRDPIEIGFSEFQPGGALARSNPALFRGDNTANRIDPITIEDLRMFTGGQSIDDFTKVEIRFGGSGAIDNVTFSTATIPEATSLVTWLLLGLCVGHSRKRT